MASPYVITAMPIFGSPASDAPAPFVAPHIVAVMVMSADPESPHIGWSVTLKREQAISLMLMLRRASAGSLDKGGECSDGVIVEPTYHYELGLLSVTVDLFVGAVHLRLAAGAARRLHDRLDAVLAAGEEKDR